MWLTRNIHGPIPADFLRGRDFRMTDLLSSLIDESANREFIRNEEPVRVVARTSVIPSNIIKSKKGIRYELLMPGLQRENIELEIEHGVLKVSGTVDSSSIKADSFSRSFKLPDVLDTSSCSAFFADGILTVKFENKAELAPRKIRIIDGEK
jgi:HSP20 family molecular chaperone IbpA